MTWRFEHSAESKASPAAIWRRYVDVPNWSEWSQHGVEWSRLDGPFEVGTKGKSKPPGLPAGRFRLVVVEPERMFATETRLPGARLLFEHVIDPLEAGVRITHRATIDGPLAPLYTWVLRRSIERSLPDGVDRLASTSATG
jgi:hypothetical protein